MVSHIFQSSILEGSLVSILRPRIKTYSKSQERSRQVRRAVPVLMLFATCPLLTLQPWLHLTSRLTPSFPPHTCAVLACFVHPPGLPAPLTLNQVPEVHHILEGLAQIPSLPKSRSSQHAHGTTRYTLVRYLVCHVVVKLVFWWMCPLLTCEPS